MSAADPSPVTMTSSTLVSRDNVQRMRRVTRENRSLWYQLSVLQQPERARACGSGSKANSDRRPVDPPPVVELRIFEGESVEEGKDITFEYNANFFLYASLEQARPMAHGRVQTPAATNPPILTGVPASGVAYLDRPHAAGYFIFPDLSVRHEGYFRLAFSLYETCKEEKDQDMGQPDSDTPGGVDWRMEIKTVPFNVFSAKKFPGLMESTELSKTVANQGCRVRIRRDVRMRKRDTKAGGGNGFDRREEDYAARRKPAATPSPDDTPLQARAQSNASDHHRSPYVPNAASRRPSAATDSYNGHTLPPPPSYDTAQYQHRRLPSYASDHNNSAQQHSHTAPRPYPPQTTHYPPTPQAQYIKNEVPYGYHSVRGAPNHHEPLVALPPPPSPSVYSHADSMSRRGSHTSYASHHGHYHSASSSSSQPSLAPLKIASLVSPLPPIAARTEPLPPPPAMLSGGKRAYDVVFAHDERPLFNGQRPPDSGYCLGHAHPTEPNPFYTRADGHNYAAVFPSFQE